MVAKRKKYLPRVLLIGLLLCLIMGVGAQAKWKTTKQGKRYYISKKAGYARGWKKISGKWYYFNEAGYLKKGWLTIDGKRYYLNKSTGARVSGKWFKVGGSYYYAAKNGVVAAGKWVGARYVKADGKRAKGWLELNGKKYYLDKSTGVRYTGWKKIGKKQYCFQSNGVIIAGKWKKRNGKYYYLKENGEMAVSTWVGKYQVGSDGARTGKTRVSGLVKQNGKYYYYNESYKKQSGWQTIGAKTYYFGSDKAAVIGLQTIDGDTFYFGKDGALLTGWQSIGGRMYYFGVGGVMAKDTTLILEDLLYTFDENGVWTDEEKGKSIVAYAMQFKGNPYVYGGTSLTNGADCSGFTMSVMKHFGISIPRTADDQRKGKDGYGTYTPSVAVQPDLQHLQAGDLIFYGIPSGHVALYIGDGKVIHASTPSTGIIVSKYDYDKPSAARRYW